MCEAQEAMHWINVAGVPSAILTLIRVVITRWTAHFLAFKWLLDLKWVLDHLIQNDELLPPKDQCLTASDSKACKKAKKMIALIKNSEFWHSIANMYIFSFNNKNLTALQGLKSTLSLLHVHHAFYRPRMHASIKFLLFLACSSKNFSRWFTTIALTAVLFKLWLIASSSGGWLVTKMYALLR